jgi:hypothetical protein
MKLNINVSKACFTVGQPSYRTSRPTKFAGYLRNRKVAASKLGMATKLT